ncbi:AarF/ABC1/UbiB kinase family protein [Acetobacteraceae bacterium]|nr:AarF/ABC1/UbiB kinase family protein [Acetobacteraceae bacterium]
MTISEKSFQDSSLDKMSLLNNTKRMVKSGTVVGGAVARATWRKLSPHSLQTGSLQEDAEKLKKSLGELRGPLVKVAQLLASIPGLLPEDYIKELSELQTQAPAMGWGFVQRRMRGELGENWQRYFGSFDREACNAASLGQVHKAVLINEKQVACKLQYPGMDKSISSDLLQLKTLFGLYSFFDGAIKQDQVYKELEDRLKEELDYRREAANLVLFGYVFRANPYVHVPRPAKKISTHRLLVMEWLEGISFSEFLKKNPSLEERNQAARELFKAWYYPFYHFGILHGDPHSGNYGIREDGGVNLFDLGSVRVFPPKFVQAVVQLYRAVKEKDRFKIVQAYKVWGFKGLNDEVVEALNAWSSFFFRPFLIEGDHSLEETNSAEAAHEVLENVYATLKKGGGVTLPREFVLLDRSALGLGGAFLRLGASLDWKKLFEEEIQDFSLEKLEISQNEALCAAGLRVQDGEVSFIS